MSTQRGVALVLALWVIALASILLSDLAVSVQLQQRQALWQRNQTQATLAAEAGVNLAVAGLLENGTQRWLPDGQIHTAHFAGTELGISVLSERGRLDLNAAPAPDLAKLLRACGATDQNAQIITTALEHRRNEVPLRMLEELRALPGVTFGLYECAQAYVTVWSGTPRPDPSLAPPLLASVLGLPRARGITADAGEIVTVTSAATLQNGFSSRLKATLVLVPAKEGAKPYRVLRWQE